MKATLGIEAIGGFKPYSPKTGIEIIDATFDFAPSSFWVAKITGLYGNDGLKRDFLYGKRDYTKSNSKGTRGIFLWYVLESGNFYEVSSPISWSRLERYFCTVSEEGEINKITKREIQSLFERKIMREWQEKKDAERQQTNDGD